MLSYIGWSCNCYSCIRILSRTTSSFEGNCCWIIWYCNDDWFTFYVCWKFNDLNGWFWYELKRSSMCFENGKTIHSRCVSDWITWLFRLEWIADLRGYWSVVLVHWLTRVIIHMVVNGLLIQVCLWVCYLNYMLGVGLIAKGHSLGATG